jgi:hypothetical protein
MGCRPPFEDPRPNLARQLCAAVIHEEPGGCARIESTQPKPVAGRENNSVS